MKNLSDLQLKDKKYFIFDMDGTLIDSIGIWNKTDQKLIEKFGNKTIDLDQLQIKRDDFHHRNKEYDTYLAYCNFLIQKYNFTIKDAAELLKLRWDISGKILEREIDFKPNVVDLILKLKRLGFKLALATMTTKAQLDIYSKKNKKMIKQMNIEEMFDFITKENDVQNKKPHPEIYNKIMQHYYVSPSECLIFEDSYTGILASKKAGIEVVNVYDKYADVNRKEIDEIADYKIMSYKEFIDFVDTIIVKICK